METTLFFTGNDIDADTALSLEIIQRDGPLLLLALSHVVISAVLGC